MAELLYRIGRIAAKRPVAVVATWVAILAVAAGAFAAFGTTPASEISIPGTPTAVVTERLAASLPGTAGANGTVVFSTRDGSRSRTRRRPRSPRRSRGPARSPA
jgi:RND superfamily putative drug exporter